ncbi:MAG: hypothetical protein COW84_00430 [Gammaproteobacteria bacterium CG22_combo_CG10-13_8_21_14_all_40_8]|nr:MAG: hypothetical protein COW84_00430 [Gammaproteobacteria bacterium CG22_combo_CG10-13_8_21_14_all_40_8]
MPKLTSNEIEIMITDEDDDTLFDEKPKRVNHSRQIEVRRRLDDYFENRKIKHEFDMDYYDYDDDITLDRAG